MDPFLNFLSLRDVQVMWVICHIHFNCLLELMNSLIVSQIVGLLAILTFIVASLKKE